MTDERTDTFAIGKTGCIVQRGKNITAILKQLYSINNDAENDTILYMLLEKLMCGVT